MLEIMIIVRILLESDTEFLQLHRSSIFIMFIRDEYKVLGLEMITLLVFYSLLTNRTIDNIRENIFFFFFSFPLEFFLGIVVQTPTSISSQLNFQSGINWIQIIPFE